jgi:putative ABC transport system substrate-binding protein
MRHFRFLVILAVPLLSWAAAAQTSSIARVGMCAVRCVGPGYDAFDDELRKLGWFEGSNLIVERKEAQGRYERPPELATEIVRSRPDLIIAATTPPALAANPQRPRSHSCFHSSAILSRWGWCRVLRAQVET